ncbi:MAG: nitroreductase family protein [Nanobdellota archaeon]
MGQDTMKTIFSRRSCRLYKRKKIPRELVYRCVEAGMKAPSAGNVQDTVFVVTSKKDIINKLPELCMGQDWISSAPTVIAVCSQPQKMAEWYGERGRHVFSVQNAAASTQNILLSAQASGLASCWIGGFDQEKVDSLFGVKGKGRVEAIVTLGYCKQRIRSKDEKNIELRLFFDSFGNWRYNEDLYRRDYALNIENKVKESFSDSDSFASQLKGSFSDLKEKFSKKK